MLLLLYYCLKVIVCSGILFGYYLLALRYNRFHQWNRYYLLASVLIAFTLPLVRIPVILGGDSPLAVYSYKILSGPDLDFTFLQGQKHFYLTMPLLISLIYIAVTIFIFSAFVKNLIRIQTLKSCPKELINGIYLYKTEEEGTPFSFFKHIFWNNNIKLSTEKGQQMLRHEMTHVHERHSIDKITLEVLLAFAWWNPFLYYIRKELSVIHEFLADQKASAGDAKLQYASLLLMKAMGSEQYVLGNPFFHTQLKRRLTMLTTINNPKFSYLRRLFALPLACILIVLFAVHCERTHEDNKALQVEKNLKQDSVTTARFLDEFALELKKISKQDSVTTGQLSEDVLYFINDIESSKKDVESLNPEEIKNMNVLIGNGALKAYGSKGANGVILISTHSSGQEVVFSKAEEPATFPGGLDGWRRYLERNLKYPQTAQEKGTQGVVRIQMVVDEKGNITETKALNDPGDGLAAEALRMIEKGPKWIPAKQNGKPVTYKFVQTITFQLQ